MKTFSFAIIFAFLAFGLLANNSIQEDLTTSFLKENDCKPCGVGIQYINNALYFDGQNDEVILPSPLTGTRDFTFEIWVRADDNSFGNYDRILVWGGSGTRLEVGERNGRLLVLEYNGSFTNYYGPNINDSNWHHVALTRASGAMTVYLDGNPVSNFNSVSLLNTSALIGFWPGTSSENWAGPMDELRIWDYARTQTEIQEQINCQLSGDETGLVSYYDFNQGTPGGSNPGERVLIDRTGNGYDGDLYDFALNGNTSNFILSDSPVDGCCGSDDDDDCSEEDNNALYFDGQNDEVILPSPLTGSADFTFEVWVRADDNSFGNYDRILVWGGSGTRLEVGERNGRLLVLEYNGSFTNYYGPNINDSNWHHVALTRASGAMTVYLDGNPVSNFNSVSLLNTSALIGFWPGTSSENWAGPMDELRIWDYARTQTEIQEQINCQLSGDETGLVSYYDFNQGTPGGSNPGERVLIDRTGNGYDGDLYDFALNGNTSNFILSDSPVDGCCGSDDDDDCSEEDNNALYFDGQNDEVILPSPLTGSADFTFEVWVRADDNSFGNYDRILVWGGSGTRLEVGERNGRLLVLEYNGSFTNYYGPNINDSNWHHVALTRASGAMTVYLDGNPVSNFNSVSLLNTSALIGFWPGTSSENWAGPMDELRIWDYARTQTEIQEQINCQLSGDETGLVSYYDFNQGTPGGSNPGERVLIDRTGNGYDGDLYDFALNGNTSNFILSDSPVDGCCGSDDDDDCSEEDNNALYFDGQNDEVILPSPLTGSADFTFEVWVRADDNSFGNYDRILVWGGSGTRLEVGERNGRLLVLEYNGSFTNYYGPNINDSNWHHVALTRASGAMTVYLDGNPVSNFNSVSLLNTSALIGFWPGTSSENWAGPMDELRIWDYARTQTEIQEQINCQLSGDETGLVSYYDFNQGTPGGSNPGERVLIDRTGNGYDGDLYDFALNGNTSNFILSDSPVDGCCGSDDDNDCSEEDNNALYFDGQNDEVILPSPLTGSADFTFEVWVRADDNSFGNYDRILVWGGSGTRLEVGERNGRLVVLEYKGWFRNYYGPNIQDKNWHHIALTRATGNMTVYLDGNPVLSFKSVSSLHTYLRLGFWPGTSNEHWAGPMDELRIWDYARTQAEIQDNMNCQLSGDENGLVTYCDANQGISNGNNSMETALLDKSGNGFDGKLYNFKLDGNISNFVLSDVPVKGCCNDSGAVGGGPGKGKVLTNTTFEQVGVQLSVMPNPTSSTLTLRLSEVALGVQRVQIMDANGKQVRYQEMEAGSMEATFNLSNLSPGLYLLVLSNEHGIVRTKKIIKQ